MKFNFWGYDTLTITKLGLDANDLAFIQWFRDFRDGGKMESVKTKDGLAYFVSYSKIIEDIPFLFKSSEGVTDEKELKKIEKTNKAKVANMLKRNLAKVFTRLEKKELGRTKMYLLLKTDVFRALTNQEEDIDNIKVSDDTTVIKLNKKKKSKKNKTESKQDEIKDESKDNIDESNEDASKDVPETKADPEINEDSKKASGDKSDAPKVNSTELKGVISKNSFNFDSSISQENNLVNGVNISELNENTNFLLSHMELDKKADIKKIDKTVSEWSGIVLEEALKITVEKADTPNFNYLANTYETLISKYGGVERAEKVFLQGLI